MDKKLIFALVWKWDFFCDFSTLCEILDSLITRRASTRDIVAEIRHLCNSYNFEFSETKMQIYILVGWIMQYHIFESRRTTNILPKSSCLLQKTWKVLLKIWQVSLMSPLNSRQFLWWDVHTFFELLINFYDVRGRYAKLDFNCADMRIIASF